MNFRETPGVFLFVCSDGDVDEQVQVEYEELQRRN